MKGAQIVVAVKACIDAVWGRLGAVKAKQKPLTRKLPNLSRLLHGLAPGTYGDVVLESLDYGQFTGVRVKYHGEVVAYTNHHPDVLYWLDYGLYVHILIMHVLRCVYEDCLREVANTSLALERLSGVRVVDGQIQLL